MNLSADKIKPENSSVRWMIRRDMQDVLSIIKQSFKNPIFEDELTEYLRSRNIVGQVIELSRSRRARTSKKIIGFMLYELKKYDIAIIFLAIDPDYRRSGLGAKMVNKLILKLYPVGRKVEISVDVRETNLSAQLFFKKLGFKAVLVDKNYFSDTEEDSYLMTYFSGEKTQKQTNRIAYFGKQHRRQ